MWPRPIQVRSSRDSCPSGEGATLPILLLPIRHGAPEGPAHYGGHPPFCSGGSTAVPLTLGLVVVLKVSMAPVGCHLGIQQRPIRWLMPSRILTRPFPP